MTLVPPRSRPRSQQTNSVAATGIAVIQSPYPSTQHKSAPQASAREKETGGRARKNQIPSSKCLRHSRIASVFKEKPGCLAGWLLSNVSVSLPNLNISARPLPPAFSSAPKFGYAYGGRLGGLPASSSGRWYPSPIFYFFFRVVYLVRILPGFPLRSPQF